MVIMRAMGRQPGEVEPLPSVVVPVLSAPHRARLGAVLGSRARLLDERDVEDPASLGEHVVLVTGMAHDRMLELSTAPGLRWVACTSSGVEHLPLHDLKRRGVILTNSAGAHGPAMAEYALGMMVSLAHGFPAWARGQRQHRWLPLDAAVVRPLHGRLLGIVGYGAVGRQLALGAASLGMRTWAIRRSPMFLAGEPIERLLRPDALPELLAASDFVVLAASLNASSRFLLGAEELRIVKPGAILVNVARGGLVDEAALVEALRSGRLAGAALDVAADEPLPPDSPLWDAPNLLVTPHVSGASAESWDAVIDYLCRNLAVYLDEGPARLGNVVSFDAVQ